MATPRVLIIGGTRFIGLHTVRLLTEQGCDIAVFHRGGTEPESLPHVQHIHGDRADLLSFTGTFERFAPDVVLDMVAITRSDAVDALIAFNGMAGRTVVVSSQDVYLAYDVMRSRHAGPVIDQPMDEESPLREQLYPYRDLFGSDHRMYDYDKIPIEQTYLAEPDLPGTILRLPAVYGPDDYQHRMFPYLKRMADGRKTILLEEGGVHWRWSRAFVDNVAAAIALAVTDTRAAGCIYNVAEPVALNEKQWIEAIGRAYEWPGEVVALASEDMPDHLRDEELDFDQSLVADSGRIRRDLDYSEPVGFEDALTLTIRWELANLPDELPPHQFDYDAEDAALPDLTLDI